MSFADSYLGSLRAVMGSQRLLSVGARVLVENSQGQFLILRRSDSGGWGLPAGGMELGESLLQTAERELLEETNLTTELTAFGLSTDPNVEHHTYPNGDKVQSVSLLVHGLIPENADVRANDGEAVEFRFCTEDEIDPAEFSTTEWPTFAHWRRFQDTGIFQVV